MNGRGRKRILELRVSDAALCSRRALMAVLLFVIWAILSVLAPEVAPDGMTSWWLVLLSSAAYGLLTLGAMLGLAWRSVAVAFDRYTRRVVRNQLMPFGLLLTLAVASGAGVAFVLATDLLAAGWVGTGSGLAVLLLGVTVARVREGRALKRRIAELAAEQGRESDGDGRPSWQDSIHTWPTLPQARFGS